MGKRFHSRDQTNYECGSKLIKILHQFRMNSKSFGMNFAPKVERRQKNIKQNKSWSQVGSVLGRNPGSIGINSRFLARMFRSLSFSESTLHVKGGDAKSRWGDANS